MERGLVPVSAGSDQVNAAPGDLPLSEAESDSSIPHLVDSSSSDVECKDGHGNPSTFKIYEDSSDEEEYDPNKVIRESSSNERRIRSGESCSWHVHGNV